MKEREWKQAWVGGAVGVARGGSGHWGAQKAQAELVTLQSRSAKQKCGDKGGIRPGKR